MECTCDKTNEITVCKELFDSLRLENAIITADAMMCQKEFAAKAALAAFGKCESRVTRMKSGKESIETRYFITPLSDVEEFARAVRSHWAIENNLHWSLDVLFHDDDCPVLDRNTAENLAIVRRIIYNRIKMQPDYDTLAWGRRSCMYDDDFRAKILFSC